MRAGECSGWLGWMMIWIFEAEGDARWVLNNWVNGRLIIPIMRWKARRVEVDGRELTVLDVTFLPLRPGLGAFPLGALAVLFGLWWLVPLVLFLVLFDLALGYGWLVFWVLKRQVRGKRGVLRLWSCRKFVLELVRCRSCRFMCC